MSDPKPVAAAPSASASATTDTPPSPPPQDPTPPKADEGGVQPRFEFNGGGAYPIPDAFQFRTEAGYLFKPWVYAGIGYMGNFTGKNSAFAALGYRFNINDVFSIQPTFIGGVGGLSDYSTTVGSLKENVTLSGLYGYINPEVRFMIEPPNVAGIGFYVAPGFMAEFRGGAKASPMTLISGEDTNPNSYAPTISFGITFGTKPKKQQPKKEDYVPPPPPVTEEPKLVEKKDLSEEELQKRIDEAKKKVIEGRDKKDAERINRSIEEVRTNIKTLKTKVVAISEGVNRTNKVGRVFEETLDKLDNLPKDKQLSAEDKKILADQLDALSTALELNASIQAVSTTPESESIRKGLRFVYLSKRYGERFQKQLDRLKKGLAEHKEKELVEKTGTALGRLNTYLDQYPDATKLEDLTQDANAIQASMQALESVEKDYNLGTNPDWTQLKQDLDSTRGIVTQMNRELNAMRDLSNVFNGNSNNMGDQVDTPEKAQKTFESAQKFIKDMPTNDKYLGVTVEVLRDHYSDYFGYLSYNLDHFINRHTPPDEKRAAERRKWFDSVKLSKDLLCQANPKHARCSIALEEPPKATTPKPPTPPPPPAPTGTGTVQKPPPPPPPPAPTGSVKKPPPPPPPPPGIQ